MMIHYRPYQRLIYTFKAQWFVYVPPAGILTMAIDYIRMKY